MYTDGKHTPNLLCYLDILTFILLLQGILIMLRADARHEIVKLHNVHVVLQMS